MESLLERISTIAEREGVTITAVERAIGASKGVLSRAMSNGTDIQSKWLVKVVENYPHYNPLWLLTGQGPMVLTKTYEVNNEDTNHIIEENQNTVYQKPVEDPLFMMKFYYKLYTENRDEKERIMQLYNDLAEEYNKLAEIANVKIKQGKIA